MITTTVVIKHKHTVPHGPGAVFGATKTDIVLQFEVGASTLAEVEERVAALIRAGLAPDASERAFDAAYSGPLDPIPGTEIPLPPTVRDSGDLDTRTRLGVDDDETAEVPDGRGKHSGNCRCKGCAEPGPGEVIKPVFPM